jgi:hypothetical protein
MQVARRPEIRLDLRLEARQPVQGDPDLLRRVLENLITNAIEAMEGAGTLTIRTRDLDGGGPPQVAIEVGDTGPGIPESFLREQLFRPFATTKKRGLGLGLYQSRTIVRAHGGELTATSRAGEGSLFRITLGAGATAQPPSPVELPAHASAGRVPG